MAEGVSRLIDHLVTVFDRELRRVTVRSERKTEIVEVEIRILVQPRETDIRNRKTLHVSPVREPRFIGQFRSEIVDQRVREQPAIDRRQRKEFRESREVIDRSITIEDETRAMHGLVALGEIKVENDVPIVLEIRRAKRDVSDGNVQKSARRPRACRITRNCADRNRARVVARRDRNELSESREIRGRYAGESLQYRETFGGRSRDVAG